MRNKHILAFDFGTKKIGLAIGQNLTKTAQPLTVIPAVNGTPEWNKISQIIQEWQPEKIIVGEPLNMDGTPQHVTFLARKFAKILATRYKLPVELVDERLTTREAQSQARAAEKKIKHVDALAACIILETWFNSPAAQGKN